MSPQPHHYFFQEDSVNPNLVSFGAHTGFLATNISRFWVAVIFKLPTLLLRAYLAWECALAVVKTRFYRMRYAFFKRIGPLLVFLVLLVTGQCQRQRSCNGKYDYFYWTFITLANASRLKFCMDASRMWKYSVGACRRRTGTYGILPVDAY